MKRKKEICFARWLEWRVKSEDFEELAWLCIYTANRRRTAGAWGEQFSSVYAFWWKRKIGHEIVIFCDFTRFHPFLIFQTIQHAKHVLTRKIVRFYEWKRDFNNLEAFQVNTYHFRWREWRALEWKKNLSVKTY